MYQNTLRYLQIKEKYWLIDKNPTCKTALLTTLIKKTIVETTNRWKKKTTPIKLQAVKVWPNFGSIHSRVARLQLARLFRQVLLWIMDFPVEDESHFDYCLVRNEMKKIFCLASRFFSFHWHPPSWLTHFAKPHQNGRRVRKNIW